MTLTVAEGASAVTVAMNDPLMERKSYAACKIGRSAKLAGQGQGGRNTAEAGSFISQWNVRANPLSIFSMIYGFDKRSRPKGRSFWL
jgi:hypothetical protein